MGSHPGHGCHFWPTGIACLIICRTNCGFLQFSIGLFPPSRLAFRTTWATFRFMLSIWRRCRPSAIPYSLPPALVSELVWVEEAEVRRSSTVRLFVRVSTGSDRRAVCAKVRSRWITTHKSLMKNPAQKPKTTASLPTSRTWITTTTSSNPAIGNVSLSRFLCVSDSGVCAFTGFLHVAREFRRSNFWLRFGFTFNVIPVQSVPNLAFKSVCTTAPYWAFGHALTW